MFNETDFQFASRLMAEEGISYYFEHKKGEHKLILCDDAQAFFDCETEKVEYDGGGSHPKKNTVSSWQRSFNYHVGGFEFKDYNEFTTAKDNKIQVRTKNLLTTAPAYLMRTYGFE